MFTTAVALNDEWESRQDSPVSWGECPELLHAVSAGDALALICQFPDPILGFLISRFQDGDELAGRTIIQAFIGKLVDLAARARARGLPHAFDEYLTSMWLAISRYPLHRRPAKIPANLTMDTHQLTLIHWRANSGRKELAIGLTPHARYDEMVAEDQPPGQPTAQEMIDLARDRGWITASMAELLVDVYSQGMTGAQAARVHGCAPATVRSQCRHGIARLRDRAEEILACCA